jgi:NAD(P)-dependent dehydrogenase (short-subunit alcohol dehydrogenase family)
MAALHSSGDKPLAVITGGQRGIGLGIAKSLHDNGFRIALLAEREEQCQEVIDACGQLGPGTVYIKHDVAQASVAADVIGCLTDKHGPITCFVSNAGVAPASRVDVLDVSLQSYHEVLAINATGAFFLAQAVANHMLETETSWKERAHAFRSIIFVTSVSASSISLNRSEYCVSKAALAMAAQLFAARLAPHNIGVYDIRPGIIRTSMTKPVAERYDHLINNGLVPQRRWGEPVDVGKVAATMARGDLAYAPGTVVAVDGALSVPRL